MTKIERSVLIDEDIQKVFAYASDWRFWGEWFEGTSDFEPTTDIERGNGARYRYKVWMMGIPATVETEVHDFEENAGWKGVATKGMAHRTRWIFESFGRSTKFTYGLEYEIPVPVLGPIIDFLLMKRTWDNIIEKSLENLKLKFSES